MGFGGRERIVPDLALVEKGRRSLVDSPASSYTAQDFTPYFLESRRV